MINLLLEQILVLKIVGWLNKYHTMTMLGLNGSPYLTPELTYSSFKMLILVRLLQHVPYMNGITILLMMIVMWLMVQKMTPKSKLPRVMIINIACQPKLIW